MRIQTFVVVGVLGTCGLVASVSRADAQGSPSAPLFGPAPQKHPLFGQQSPLNQQREELARLAAQMSLQAGKPKVVCGMTVIPAQPAVDPKSITKAPEDRKYTMRSVRPQICGDTAQDPDVAPQLEPPTPDVQPAR